MSLIASVRKVAPLFVIFALLIVLVVVVLRRAGFITETVVLRAGPAAAAVAHGGEGRTLEIITLLPKDAIPAIFDPQFVNTEEANSQLRDADLVIGVTVNGEHRAYGVAFLSSHEIVNDTLGGRPIAVTW
jgi:hypothetical protein